MTDIFCHKVKTGTSYALIPAHESDLEAIKSLPNREPVRVKITRMRNVQFHRKYFALLNYAFDCWQPPCGPDIDGLGTTFHDKVNNKNYTCIKSFDRFRSDIIILAGFYEAYYRINGEVRIEPKSISFAKMSQEDFEELYSKTIDVIIKYVLTNYTGDELKSVIEQVLEFDGGGL